MSRTIVIRRLCEEDAASLWELRLTALESNPLAFAESAAEHRRTTVEEYAERLRLGGGESFVLGAFDGTGLVGMVGLYREQRAKHRHKARIWGMFVRASHRGMGAGRALLAAAVEHARALPELRQLELSVAATQDAARSLYIGLGFRPYGVEPQALMVGGGAVDEEHMVLLLDGGR